MSTLYELIKDKVSWPIALAGVMSVAWVIISIICLNQERVFGLERNAFGDFVGGFFGPLALLWLIVGVLQQGADLRHQRTELTKHVEATEKLVVVDRELLEHDRLVRKQEKDALDEQERKAEPRFRYQSAKEIKSANIQEGSYLIVFENLGGPFVVKRIYSITQNKDVTIDGHSHAVIENFAIDRGDRTYIGIGPLQQNETLRFLMDVTYGRDHVGIMEVVGIIGKAIEANLEKRV